MNKIDSDELDLVKEYLLYHYNDPTSNKMISDRINGDNNTLTYRFAEGFENTESRYPGKTLADVARDALQAWTEVTGILFEEREDLTEREADFTFHPGENNVTGVNGRSPIYMTETASTSTFMHEIGHKLGLAHTHSIPEFRAAGLDHLDTEQISIMSYNPHQSTHGSNEREWKIGADTPQIADILAIQEIYGAPNHLRTEDTTWGVNTNLGEQNSEYLEEFFTTLTGDGEKARSYQKSAFTILDNGGTDTIDFSNDTRDQRVNLNPEWTSDVYGYKGNMVIARDTIIENYVAGSGDDLVIGNMAGNVLEGRDGDDNILKGGDGDDRLFGGQGDDRLYGGEGNDALRGGPGEDTLHADGHAMDALHGGPGHDVFVFYPSDLGGGTIQDFTDGEDMIRLGEFRSDGYESIDDLDITSHGNNVHIELAGEDYLTIIILSDFDANNLDESDFSFIA